MRRNKCNCGNQVPSEFYQIEQAVTEQVAKAKAASVESIEAAKQSAENAKNKDEALTAAQNAKEASVAAEDAKDKALIAESNAKNSEINAKASEVEAKSRFDSIVTASHPTITRTEEVQVLIDWLRRGQDTGGSIYNETGYITGYRLNSSGNLSSETGGLTTGFIPVKKGDIIRLDGFFMCGNTAYVNGLRGVSTTNNVNLEYYVMLYTASHTHVGGSQLKTVWEAGDEFISLSGGIKCHCDSNGVVDYIDLSDISESVAYVRLNSWALDMSADTAKITIDGSTETKVVTTETVDETKWVYTLRADLIQPRVDELEKRDAAQDTVIQQLTEKVADLEKRLDAQETKLYVPAYTTADNGKVIAVQGGVMVWKYPSDIVRNSDVGIVTDDNEFVLSDSVPAGTYTLKYEDDSGVPLDEWREIGKVVVDE